MIEMKVRVQIQTIATILYTFHCGIHFLMNRTWITLLGVFRNPFKVIRQLINSRWSWGIQLPINLHFMKEFHTLCVQFMPFFAGLKSSNIDRKKIITRIHLTSIFNFFKILSERMNRRQLRKMFYSNCHNFFTAKIILNIVNNNTIEWHIWQKLFG